MRRFRGYVSARLHRRLFVWFGVTILLTGLAVGGTVSLLSRAGAGWAGAERLERFLGDQFSAVWDDPPRRDGLAGSIAGAFELDVTLVDAAGSRLSAVGKACDHPWMRAPVARGEVAVGAVLVCGRRAFPPWKALLPLFVACVFLWGAAGKLARRLARPLSELTQVAQALGAGRLSSRARLGCRVPGEIGVLSNALNEMASRIERQIGDQRELLAGVSHELRTPLARQRLLVELMRESGEPDRLDELEREVLEMDGLVGELLASARLDFAVLDRRPLDARELARRALERAGESEARLVVDAPDTRLSADPTLLARALSNLLDNARRHGQGIVAVRVTAPCAGSIAFEVDDAGPGFPAGGEAQLFRPFAPRADGHPREPGSLGLGLSLVRRIAEAHGGRAWAANRPEGGGRVGFEVPAGVAPGPVPA